MRMRGELRGLSLNWQTRRTMVTMEVDATPEQIEKYTEKDLTVEIKQYHEKRSLDANSYYWVLCQKIAAAVSQKVSVIHNHNLREYGQIQLIDGQAIYLVIPDTETAQNAADEATTYHIKPTSQVKEGIGGKMYRTYMMLKGSHEFNTAEMSRLIDGAVAEAKNLGIETATPEELERMKAIYGEKHNAD